MCGEEQVIRDPRDMDEFEEDLQRKRREARLYDKGYNSLLEECFR
jgi:hypothetical protein